MAYDVNGRWWLFVQDPTGDIYRISLDLEVDGGRVTGTGQSPQGTASIYDGTYADGVVKFKTTSGREVYYELTATADGRLVGNIDFGGGQLSYITAGRGEAPPWVPNDIPGWV